MSMAVNVTYAEQLWFADQFKFKMRNFGGETGYESDATRTPKWLENRSKYVNALSHVLSALTPRDVSAHCNSKTHGKNLELTISSSAPSHLRRYLPLVLKSTWPLPQTGTYHPLMWLPLAISTHNFTSNILHIQYLSKRNATVLQSANVCHFTTIYFHLELSSVTLQIKAFFFVFTLILKNKISKKYVASSLMDHILHAPTKLVMIPHFSTLISGISKYLCSFL